MQNCPSLALFRKYEHLRYEILFNGIWKRERGSHEGKICRFEEPSSLEKYYTYNAKALFHIISFGILIFEVDITRQVAVVMWEMVTANKFCLKGYLPRSYVTLVM